MTVTRTIVIGKNTDLIKTLLFLLTYFIRCFDIEDICEMEPNEFNSQVSDHIIPESDQHFSDFSIESSQEIVASTPSKKKPHPFSFCVMKSFIPQSHNSDLSYEDSFEQSSSHASKSGEHISRSWQLKASLSDSNHFSYEDNPTACSSKAVASGLSDNRATPSSCDNNDNMSVHTNVPSPPSFSKRQQKTVQVS